MTAAAKVESLTPAQWEQVHQERARWLAAGTSCEPADRPAAEAAITEMYHLLGKPAPRFVWVASPATASLAIHLLSGKAESSLGSSLGSSLWSSLGSSLGSSLRSSLWSSLRSSLRSSLESSLRSLRSCFWGQHEAYWIAFYDVPRRLGIVTYSEVDSRALGLWATLARSCGWWWPYENTCVVSERPSLVRTETWDASQGTVRLHCADGPAMLFPDGWPVYAWHGTSVPAGLIEDGWDMQRILTERNAEVRRCAIEKLGWGEFEKHLPKVAEAADPGNPGQVITLYDLPPGLEDTYPERARLLLCTNGTPEPDGTRRRFGLPVPAHHTDPAAAAAELYGWPVEAYRNLARRA